MGNNSPIPHNFTDKAVIIVRINEAFLEGELDAVPYTWCEVYAPRGLDTRVRIHSFLYIKLDEFNYE